MEYDEKRLLLFTRVVKDSGRREKNVDVEKFRHLSTKNLFKF